MPADTNPSGDIFGGWLMAQMDLAGGSAAGRRAGGRAATVAVDSMSFLRPVKVGDEVSIYATHPRHRPQLHPDRRRGLAARARRAR